MIQKEGGPIDFYPRCLKRHLLSKDVESFLKRLYLYGASLTTEVKALKTQGQMPLKHQLRLRLLLNDVCQLFLFHWVVSCEVKSIFVVYFI